VRKGKRDGERKKVGKEVEDEGGQGGRRRRRKVNQPLSKGKYSMLERSCWWILR
jgi:hypothetical protein